MAGTSRFELIYGLGRPKPAVIQMIDRDPNTIRLKRRVVMFKKRKYVIFDSFIRWQNLVSVSGNLIRVPR